MGFNSGFKGLMVGPALHPLASGNKSGAVLLNLLIRFYSWKWPQLTWTLFLKIF